MLRRLAILATVLFATAAHASGNLTVDLDRSGQLFIDHQAVGVPVGTPLNVDDCTATFADVTKNGPCVVMTDAQTGHVVGQTLTDPTGETLTVQTDALIVRGLVVGETFTVRDARTQRVRIDLRPDHGVTVHNG
ncbi:hypothetical protein [Paraburkholderia dilworthii]|uniref:DUF5666 domain-containing protein n=1 Tax=Paraburkholderia dilworthii TaxID=948106 RepID=A0ABW9D766_9BURK